MEFGLTFEKLLLIGVLVAVIVGPERLPRAAEGFARFVRRAREYVNGVKTQVRDEMGPEINDVDWRKLDPRQYDPRRIIRDALLEEPKPLASPAPVAIAEPSPGDLPQESRTTAPPPVELEAT